MFLLLVNICGPEHTLSLHCNGMLCLYTSAFGSVLKEDAEEFDDETDLKCGGLDQCG